MDVCLMIEGQEDVTWGQWLALAAACEEHGFQGLFRSDHYLSVMDEPARGSLDAWTVLAGLAARTERIRLGTLVSPVTFRHPSVLAKSAATVDHISGGRVELGMGAGWHRAEHTAYGFPFPEDRIRMQMLEEQLHIVHGMWRQEGSFSFQGRHYRLDGVRALPTPLQRPHPPIVIGGKAGPWSARLSAQYADEYNVNFVDVEECRRRRGRVAAAWERAGRDPDTLRFSLMTPCLLGADRQDLRGRVSRFLEMSGDHQDPDRWLAGAASLWVAGTPDQAVVRLQELEGAGVQRVMLQHLVHDDLEMVALIGREVIPRVG
jgi:F420-dependent oxidoreductase-like protein